LLSAIFTMDNIKYYVYIVVCWCVHCLVIRFLYHTIVNTYVLHFARDNTYVLCEHPEDGHIGRNMLVR
jgi:hypothetical protein